MASVCNAADTTFAIKLARGIVFTAPPAEVYGQRVARFVDPDGAETSVGG